MTEGRGAAPRAFSPLEYRDPAPAPWLIHALGALNRWVLLPGLLRITRFDLPNADARRLRAVYEIVNASPSARGFWLANNLVANAPGGGGKAFSVDWALRGHGVLLHPEGMATWQGERVAALLPGLVDMAWDTARHVRAARGERPVWLVPVAWRFAFRGDARRALGRDMSRLERGLSLPRGDRLEPPERFAALIRHLLARQCERLGLGTPLAGEHDDYFAAQSRVVEDLLGRLAKRYGAMDPDFGRALFQVRRAMRERAAVDPAGVKSDGRLVAELHRLTGFDPALYDRAELARERIAEVLKRTRTTLLKRGFANALHNTVPVAVGPRAVHVRVAEPIEVRADGGGDEAAGRTRLLAEHRARLQATLDLLGDELAASGACRPLPNLLHRGQSTAPAARAAGTPQL